MSESGLDAELKAAYEDGSLGFDESDTPDEAAGESDLVDIDDIDWADVWDLAGLENGVGTMSMTQLTLALNVYGVTREHNRERAGTAVDEAVDDGLLVDVGEIDGTTFALSGGRR